MDSDKVMPYRVGVVLPAAGCGERMKLQTPKQFCEVNGRPLISFTIDCFHRLPWVQQIVISTSKAHMAQLEELTVRYSFDKVAVVEGGTTRHRSIYAGVRALQQVDPSVEVVVIHDAVRPFVSPEILKDIASAAYLHGAAGVCRPLVSTVIARNAEQKLTESLDRSRYVNSEMPQAFQVPVIAKAYSQCDSDDLDFGTECLLLAMKYGGVQAHILDGSPDLWKVTYKKDLFAAEAMLKEQFLRVSIINKDCWTQLADAISAQLSAAQLQVVEQFNPAAGTGDNMPSCNTFIILHSHQTVTLCEGVPDQSSSTTKTAANVSCFDGDCDVDRKDVNGMTDSVRGQSNQLLDRLRFMQGRWASSVSCCRLVDCTFVHVFVAPTQAEGMILQNDLSRALLTLSRECGGGGTLVYGVLASKENCLDDVSELTSSIIHRGHRSFSGQLFLVL